MLIGSYAHVSMHLEYALYALAFTISAVHTLPDFPATCTDTVTRKIYELISVRNNKRQGSKKVREDLVRAERVSAKTDLLRKHRKALQRSKAGEGRVDGSTY